MVYYGMQDKVYPMSKEQYEQLVAVIAKKQSLIKALSSILAMPIYGYALDIDAKNVIIGIKVYSSYWFYINLIDKYIAIYA